ncbi:MAG: hypothetical protein ACM3SP_08305 [Chloroflexota bacterium]
MMCRFLSADFELSVRCPVDQRDHSVRLQAYPQLRGHALDVLACDGRLLKERPSCNKACRDLLEAGRYWQNVYPNQAVFGRCQ